MKKLSNDYISVFCLEVSLLFKAGITINEGLEIMTNDETDRDSATLLKKICDSLESGLNFSSALEATEAFPEYMIRMISLSEKTGRQEETLSSLSDYYDTKERLRKSIISSILYPMILFVLMMVVVIILLTKVLPVFDSIFKQLGTTMSGFSGTLLTFGRSLEKCMPIFGIIGAAILCLCAIYAFSEKFREKCLGILYRFGRENGITKKIATLKFALALTMAMKSGMDTEESVKMASSVCEYIPDMKRKCDDCLDLLESGKGLAKALDKTKIFPSVFCRLLDLGIKSGSPDTVMTEISKRFSTEVDESLSETVGRIEPTLVVISALLIGIIMMTAMLPLINILTAIN